MLLGVLIACSSGGGSDLAFGGTATANAATLYRTRLDAAQEVLRRGLDPDPMLHGVDFDHHDVVLAGLTTPCETNHIMALQLRSASVSQGQLTIDLHAKDEPFRSHDGISAHLCGDPRPGPTWYAIPVPDVGTSQVVIHVTIDGRNPADDPPPATFPGTTLVSPPAN